jgi:YbbR domain-containing protein
MSRRGAQVKVLFPVGWLREALFGHYLLKIASLAVSLAFFAYVHSAQNVQRNLTVGIVALMPPDGMARQLVSAIPNDVVVTLKGSRTQLDSLRADDIGPVQLDLRSGAETVVQLDASMFQLPPGVVLKHVHPPAIELQWDQVVERLVPVQVSRIGEAGKGLSQDGSIRVQPSEVMVRGPRAGVDVIQFVRAAPFDVTGLSAGQYKRQLALDKPACCTLDVPSTMAELRLARERVKKVFSGLKVEVVGMPRAVTTPSAVTVTVEGTPEDIAALGKDAVVPRVEPKDAGIDPMLAGKQAGSAMLDVKVELDRVTVEVQPKQVLLKW